MLAGAALVLGLTAAARTLGTTWSGLLTILPIATSVLAASSQRSGGPDQTLHLLRGLASGLYSLTAFFATLAFGLERWSIAGSFLAAIGASGATQLVPSSCIARGGASPRARSRPATPTSFRAAIGEAPRRFLEASAYCGSGENASDEWLALPARAPAAALGVNRRA